MTIFLIKKSLDTISPSNIAFKCQFSTLFFFCFSCIIQFGLYSGSGGRLTTQLYFIVLDLYCNLSLSDCLIVLHLNLLTHIHWRLPELPESWKKDDDDNNSDDNDDDDKCDNHDNLNQTGKSYNTSRRPGWKEYSF